MPSKKPIHPVKPIPAIEFSKKFARNAKHFNKFTFDFIRALQDLDADLTNLRKSSYVLQQMKANKVAAAMSNSIGSILKYSLKLKSSKIIFENALSAIKNTVEEISNVTYTLDVKPNQPIPLILPPLSPSTTRKIKRLNTCTNAFNKAQKSIDTFFTRKVSSNNASNQKEALAIANFVRRNFIFILKFALGNICVQGIPLHPLSRIRFIRILRGLKNSEFIFKGSRNAIAEAIVAINNYDHIFIITRPRLPQVC